MVKATRSAKAELGAAPAADYRFQLTREHAARLDVILGTTLQQPADWLAQVLIEECEKLGKSVPETDVEDSEATQGVKSRQLSLLE